MKTILILSLLLGGLLATSKAQTLPSGEYRFTAPLGPIYLDGRYPILLGDLPEGFADLVTTPQGSVQGAVEMLGSGLIPVTGAIAVQNKTIRMRLTGKSTAGAFSANCVLSGRFFTGTFTIRGKKIPAQIDVLGVSPILVDYALMLTGEKGRIKGTGTLSVGRQSIPVSVTGTSTLRRVALTVRGGKTVWQGSGLPPQLGTLSVSWTARGFGSAVKGRDLAINQF